MGDLLALEPALSVLDVLEQARRLRPVTRHHGEDVGEGLAHHGVAPPVQRRTQHHLVLQRPRHDGVGHRRAQEHEVDRPFFACAVVEFQAALRLVAVVTHDGLELLPLDATLLVDQREVVPLPLAELVGHERVDLGEIVEEAKLHRFLRLQCRRGGECGRGEQRPEHAFFEHRFHRVSSLS